MYRVVFALLLLLSPAAFAFGYIEHGFFSDRACLETQQRLGREIREGDERLVPRYLAMALMCPTRWDRPYCVDGYKVAEGSLHEIDGPGEESGDHSITLGDLSALADHLSDYGPVRGYPLASRRGLTLRLFEWLAQSPGDAGGVESDVGEDACETGELVDFGKLGEDLDRRLQQAESERGLPELPDSALVPHRREPVTKGPVDPSGPYSFDNPQYLDLVLRNHDHFGERAYASWLGFHTAAKEMAAASCADLLALDAGELADLAEGLPAFESLRWKKLDERSRRVEGCRLVGERIRLRLEGWKKRADSSLVAPVASTAFDEALLGQTASALLGLLFEAGGLHYLQDNLAGGHLRTPREARGLSEARYDHDTDNEAGVLGVFSSAAGTRRFVAFGDHFLVGPATAHDFACEGLERSAPSVLTECLVSWQRGLLVAATTASLLDWADSDSEESRLHRHRYLPTRSTVPDGLGPGGEPPETPGLGTLPVPPPPFAYESLLFSNSIDGGGRATQTGVRLEFLSELGGSRHWLSSVEFGLLMTHGSPTSPEFSTELSYRFHFRWAARFLLFAGVGLHQGLRGYGEEISWYGGVVPTAGLSLLPEGWTRLPLAISLGYRLPVTLMDSRFGLSQRSVRLEAHWIELGFGLAFM